MLTLACIASAGSSKSLLIEIKPIYQVIDSNGILGRSSPWVDVNTFLMDCTRCFPEGRVTSMKIRDVTEKCRKISGDTVHNRNKTLAIIYCPPCDDYDLLVSANVMIEGVAESLSRIFKYRKDACPWGPEYNYKPKARLGGIAPMWGRGERQRWSEPEIYRNKKQRSFIYENYRTIAMIAVLVVVLIFIMIFARPIGRLIYRRWHIEKQKRNFHGCGKEMEDYGQEWKKEMKIKLARVASDEEKETGLREACLYENG